MAAPSKFDEKTRRAVQAIKQRMDEMMSYTDRVCNQLNMSAAARLAAEKVYKSYICGKKLFLFPRHNEDERFFLRLMIRLALAIDPNLVNRAEEVAKYYSSNYGFEWINSEITAGVRDEARAIILSVGDSSFGETGIANAFAYARCHYRSLKFNDVGDYGKTYALAASLQAHGDFNNKNDEMRRALGIDKLRARREAILGPVMQQPSEQA
jgi:hypothetical protein